MIAGLLLAMQVVTAQAVATCRVPDDPQQRVWTLERAGDGWRVAFSARSLDKPRVELPLRTPRVSVSPDRIHVEARSANGGLAIDWTIAGASSSIDLLVNHGLEINVERDLDPDVDLMNTAGPLAVNCLRTGSGERAAGSRSRSGDGEWQVAGGVAKSVNLFESTAGRAYVVQTIGWARELTGDLQIIGIRGRFGWGVEAMPLFAQFKPSPIRGVGFAPVVWRWNFPPRPTWSAYGELSMGGMWSTEPIPEDTSRGNFTAHWGGGVRLRPRGRQSVLVAYRFQHFSNGNQLGDNPGVNSHVVIAGWSRRH